MLSGDTIGPLQRNSFRCGQNGQVQRCSADSGADPGAVIYAALSRYQKDGCGHHRFYGPITNQEAVNGTIAKINQSSRNMCPMDL